MQPDVVLLRVKNVASMNPKRFRDKWHVGVRKEDRNKLLRLTPGLVHLGCDQLSLPIRPLSSVRLPVATEALVICLRADDQNEVCPIQSVEHPARPAFLRRALDILVNLDLHAIAAHSFRQLKHAIFVLRGIVAVADEDFGRIRCHFAPPKAFIGSDRICQVGERGFFATHYSVNARRRTGWLAGRSD